MRPLSPSIRHTELRVTSSSIPDEDPPDSPPTELIKFNIPPDVTSNSPANVPLPPSPPPPEPLTLSENAVTDIESSHAPSDPTSETKNFLPSSSSTENPNTMPIITFPSTAHFFDFKPIALQPLSLGANPSLDLSWSPDSRTTRSKERELSPFEEFMPSTIDFQPPPPKPNSELQNILESFFLNWGGLKPDV